MKPTGATKLTELYVASESKSEEGDATIRMRAGDVWVGQVKRKHAAEIVAAVNEHEQLRYALRMARTVIFASNKFGTWNAELAVIDAALNEVEG